MDTKKLLLESVEKVLAVDRANSDGAATAFNSLKKSVAHAASSRTETPEALLGDLDHKPVVLKFLFEYHQQRKIYRKQVAVVVEELLKINAWSAALQDDQALFADMPDELKKLLASKTVNAGKPSPSGAATRASPSKSSPQSMQPGSAASTSKLHEQIGVTYPFEKSEPSTAKTRLQRLSAACMLPIRVAGPAVSGNVILSKSELDKLCSVLQQGTAEMESLDFSAEKIDLAVTAFEIFRRAVQQVSNTTSVLGDGNVLEKLEPKGKILDFLVDMYERHQKYRSRVTSTLTRLLNFDSWNKAASSPCDISSDNGRSSGALAGGRPGASDAKWTPWSSPASPSQSSTAPAQSRNPFDKNYVGVSGPRPHHPSARNPFSDNFVRTSTAARRPGATDIWKDPPFAFGQRPRATASQPRQGSKDLPRRMSSKDMLRRTNSKEAPRRDFAPAARIGKPTNPFGPGRNLGTPGASAASTNLFKRAPVDASPPPNAAAFTEQHAVRLSGATSTPRSPSAELFDDCFR